MSAVFEVAAPCAEFAECIPSAPRVAIYLHVGLGLTVRPGDRVRILALSESGARYSGESATVEVTEVGTRPEVTQVITGRLLFVWDSGSFPVAPVPVCALTAAR